MRIGIDASRAFLENRTGIEEYSYQIIKHLMDKLEGHEVILYISTNYELNTNIRITNIEEDIRTELKLPSDWKIKVINWPRFWTQAGLSLEMLFHPVDVLFVPAHTVPVIHPGCRLLKFIDFWSSFFGKRRVRGKFEKKTIVTIHGIEYEILPQAYSFWERIYMRFSIKSSCKWASEIISVSENTKKDLRRLYDVPEEKITVIYEGTDFQETRNKKQETNNYQIQKCKFQPNFKFEILRKIASQSRGKQAEFQSLNSPYLLFIGRIEERKNVIGIIEAFEILKDKYNISHKLVLAGKVGYGGKDVYTRVYTSVYTDDILLTGYVSEEEKWGLLENADVFVFPTFYEGFGLPILEAQSVGIPVVASNNSSVPEVVSLKHESNETLKRDSALLVNPNNSEEIAKAVYKIISNEELRNDLIEKGYGNIKRFSWDKCAKEISAVLLSGIK